MDANEITEFLGGCQVFEEETFDGFMERYQGFGKELYAIIKFELPDVFQHLKLYKAVAANGTCVGGYSPNDSYAIYSYGGNCFAIQLNYYGNIIVFNSNNSSLSFETGDWSEIPLKDTVDFLKSVLAI